MDDNELQNGQWAIVEIMGRKVVAGYASQSVKFGVALVRIDVPATSAYPAFTQEYGAASIYAITYVSEEVARLTAESVKTNPVAVYVPDLEELRRAKLENDSLRQEIRNLRALPAPGPGDPTTDPTKTDPTESNTEGDEPLDGIDTDPYYREPDDDDEEDLF